MLHPVPAHEDVTEPSQPNKYTICQVMKHVWTTTMKIRGPDGNIELTLNKELSATIIQEVMQEPIHILKTTANVIQAMDRWHCAMAVRIIMKPRKYRDNEEAIKKLPWKSALKLFAKIDEIYPLIEHAPTEYRELLNELRKKWEKACSDLIKSWNKWNE